MLALQDGDFATAESCFEPDAAWWMNGRLRGRFGDLLPELKRAKAAGGVLRHEQIRRMYAAEGFTDQHLVRLQAPGGGEVELAVCVVVRVGAGGRVTRLEEYFDGAAIPRP
jgi:ketosteroid isomerase-like protein